MLRTYKALLNGNRLKWVDEKPDDLSIDKNAPVFVTILDKEIPEDINKKETLAEFFRNSPLYNAQIDLERDQDFGREVDL